MRCKNYDKTFSILFQVVISVNFCSVLCTTFEVAVSNIEITFFRICVSRELRHLKLDSDSVAGVQLGSDKVAESGKSSRSSARVRGKKHVEFELLTVQDNRSR